MKICKSVLLISSLACLAAFSGGSALADTIITNDGKEIKGIVVEDYKDRVVFSTVDGEITVMKSDMRELSFDSEEENLIKLAEQASERRNYSRAMTYYDMALKVNPDSAPAKQGMAYIRGNIFRKEEALKAADIKRQQDIELSGGRSPAIPEPENAGSLAGTLEKLTGIRITIAENIPRIETVKLSSPAYETGLRKGDLLVSVWGKLTGYLSLEEILDLLINKSAIEIRCVIEHASDVAINPNRTTVLGPDGLIGASFAMEIDGLTIAAVKEDGSALKAGLQEGDLVMAIDGKQTRYMPLKKAVELIKGSKMETVKLTLRRKVIIWRESGI